MPRPSILPLPPAQAKAAALAARSIEKQNASAPNRVFLHSFIPALQAITGRIYGAQTYQKLLREVAPDRSPSSTTIQAVIDALRQRKHDGKDVRPGLVTDEVHMSLAGYVAELEEILAALRRERDEALAQLNSAASEIKKAKKRTSGQK